MHSRSNITSIKRINGEKGTSTVEMACIAALTVVVAIASMGWLGDRSSDTFNDACLAIEGSDALGQPNAIGNEPRKCGEESIPDPTF